MSVVVLGEGSVTLQQLAAVARDRVEVQLAGAAVERMTAGRDAIERALAEERPVYGLTRGLGQRATLAVGATEREEMSAVMLRARACGAAPFFDREAVRAFLFARLASFCQGRSGIRPAVAEAYVAFLNRGLHPRVPEIGSGGASDLPLLACLALPAIGEGQAEIDGLLLPGAEALARAGLAPLALAPKEGLALCSASSVSTGLGALVLLELRRLLDLAEVATTLSFEAFRANLSPLDARVVAARPAPGQAAAAAALQHHLAGSSLHEPGQPRRLQDPLSLRCASQVAGALHAALAFAEPNVLAELNGAGDNPVVLFESGEILSNGNFHTPAFAQAFDLLALSLATMASLTAQRLGRLLERKFTDLPDRLSVLAEEGRLRIGFGMLGMTARQLVKEIKALSLPASLDDSSGYDVEDHDPMTPRAVRKLRAALPLWRQLIACEAIVAAEAFDLRAPGQAAPAAVRLRDLVRARVARLVDDRPMTEDLQRIDTAIRDGEIAA